MKISFISAHKRTPKMSITMKEYIGFEATDKKISEAQETFISLSALEEVLKKTVSSSESNEIMSAVELLLESIK